MTQKETALLTKLHEELQGIKLSQENIFKELVGDPTYFREGLIQRQLRDEEFQTTVTTDLKEIQRKTDKLFEKHDSHETRLKKLESKLSIFDSLSTIRKGTAWLIVGGLTFLTTFISLWEDIKALFIK